MAREVCYILFFRDLLQNTELIGHEYEALKEQCF